jgi:2-polyprenyl-6-methoxyphenol hydroxylase-like FAD-dependent oxidoreductase
MSRPKILVSGAGIAGPTIAYWLLRRGFAPTLIERAARFREGGYIVDFWGVGFDVAERMGLIPTLRKAGYIIDRIAFVAEDGRQKSAVGDNMLERTLGDRILSIQRGDLANAIYRAIEHDVEMICGDSIAGISQEAEGVEVTFERASPRTFALVIGADGLHSTVRAALFGPQQKFERYLGYYAASFLASGYPERDEHAYLSYAAPGRQISRYALREGSTGFLLVFENPNKVADWAHDLAAQKQILRHVFSREPWIEWPQIERHLEACDDLYFDAVSQITLPSWSQGRTALVGDAAYCPSLLAGEGAAFAMAGAYILASELERAGGDFAGAFAAYERRFRPFVERKQKSARAFASSFAPKTSFGLFVRNQVLRLCAVPPVGDFLMRRFVADRFLLPE